MALLLPSAREGSILVSLFLYLWYDVDWDQIHDLLHLDILALPLSFQGTFTFQDHRGMIFAMYDQYKVKCGRFIFCAL